MTIQPTASMILSALVLIQAALLSPVQAQKKAAELVWAPERPRPDFPGEFLNDPGAGPAWQIRNTNSGPLEVRLWTLTKPSVTNLFYAVRGTIAYEDVQGDGFLELWNVFPPLVAGGPAGRYFSRTLAESGEMGRVRGTSGWREFVLPFNRTGTSNGPSQLEVNLHLAGPGLVRLGSMQLVEYSGGPVPVHASGADAWWTPRTTGILGGVTGALFGTLGGILGTLSARGRARTFVLATTRTAIGVGVVLMAVGLFALYRQQPPHVWSTSFLAGVLIAGIYGTNHRSIRRRFAELELLRMTALDASAGNRVGLQ